MMKLSCNLRIKENSNVKRLERKQYYETINPFSNNVPFTDKPGSWFLPAKCLKNTCGKVKY